jgi:hypothetical protein
MVTHGGISPSPSHVTAPLPLVCQGKVFLLRNVVMQSTLSVDMHQLGICPRLLADPAMWAAEIRDAVTNDVIWSSWADEWLAYDTVDEATARAITMLSQLSLSRPTAA